jgi:wobble nucleotide-excising tRNase
MLSRYNELVDALKKLEEDREEYNKTATDTKELEEKLKRVNSEIAYYDIAESAQKHKLMTAKKEAETVKYNKLRADRDEIWEKIEKLELEKKNAKIAMDLINDDLAYIFFSKNRLRIEFKDDKYVLFAHEKPVQPSNVSVGERNAIGLCYFFNSIMENRDEGEMYKKPYFLTIDDPVSSFDTENRIGILSYLKYKLGQLSIGNKDSRFLIMTHDLQTLFDTKHLVDEILKKMLETHKNMPGKPKDYLSIYELKNLNLEKIANIVDRSEYTTLFEVIFNYADRAEPTYNSSIGNIMRKVTEAFGTFVYKKGIDDLSIDEKIVSTLSPREKAYFGNLMYRLVLNSGSHMKERVETINDMNFFDFISDADKKRTARDLICFLYKLNPLHVLAHLKSIENAESVIKQWCSEIDS